MRISPSCASTPSGGEAPVVHAAGLLPLTVPEVRRLLWHLVWERPPSVEAVEHWSAWRRRHQQRARECHWRKRTRRRVNPGCSTRCLVAERCWDRVRWAIEEYAWRFDGVAAPSASRGRT